MPTTSVHDEDQRAAQCDRGKIRTGRLDAQYLRNFTPTIRRLYPDCPEETATKIAEHACEKHSGGVGRSAGAKALIDRFVNLAVRAHICHTETNYDELLSQCYDRQLAREQVSAM